MYEGGTYWNRLADVTDKEIMLNAISDPDNHPFTDEELRNLMSLKNLPGTAIIDKHLF